MTKVTAIWMCFTINHGNRSKADCRLRPVKLIKRRPTIRAVTSPNQRGVLATTGSVRPIRYERSLTTSGCKEAPSRCKTKPDDLHSDRSRVRGNCFRDNPGGLMHCYCCRTGILRRGPRQALRYEHCDVTVVNISMHGMSLVQYNSLVALTVAYDSSLIQRGVGERRHSSAPLQRYRRDNVNRLGMSFSVVLRP